MVLYTTYRFLFPSFAGILWLVRHHIHKGSGILLSFSDTALWTILPAILRRNRIHLWILADNWFCYWIQKFQQFLINLSFTLMLSSNTALPWRRIHAYSGEDTDTSTSEFVFMEGLKKFEQIFQEVLLYSGLSPDHAKILSQRMLSIYQGYLLLGRISNNTSFLKNARKNMLEMYREYRSYHEIWIEPSKMKGHILQALSSLPSDVDTIFVAMGSTADHGRMCPALKPWWFPELLTVLHLH